MSADTQWRSLEGRATIKSIVTTRIPAWKDGLRPQQEEPILTLLDGEDVLLCTATGDGKSALFIVPILVHLEVSKRPNDFPDFPGIRAHPVLVVITPTKGLASNIVEGLKKYDIAAIVYDRETVAAAHVAALNLVHEVSSCSKYHVICVDPEHLHSDDWRRILSVSAFCNNLVAVIVEEAHLVVEWLSFRKSYGGIGPFLRGRLPPDVPVGAISATVEPGAVQTAVCQSLGLIAPHLHVFRFSNERLDVQIIFEPLLHGMKSRDFPQLLPFLNTGRRAMIYGYSCEMVTSIFEYLLRCEPPGVDHGRRVRQYSALCEPDFNAETLRLAETDPELQVIVATVALANGINVLGIDDSISVSMPSTLSQMEQQAGRVARAPDATGRAIVLYQKKDKTDAKKFKSAIANGAAARPLLVSSQSAVGKKKKKDPMMMDPGKADLLMEIRCLNAVRNERYQNPPLEKTMRDCVEADRPNKCSLCHHRYKLPLPVHEPPPNFRPFIAPAVTARVSIPKDRKLQKKEEPLVLEKLNDFASNIFDTNLFKPEYENRPEAWFFPPSLQSRILTEILRIDTKEELAKILQRAKWPFHTSHHCDDLWELIRNTRREILGSRPPPKSTNAPAIASGKRQKKRARRNSWVSQSDSDDEDLDDPSAAESESDKASISRSPSPRRARRRSISALFTPKCYESTTTRARAWAWTVLDSRASSRAGIKLRQFH
ncbi:P-loop containing nucleoside triphosphate hydrolase protein [Roridomyces roridus]|uniref:DNA 3'-5' helicase n=1 Tax=Roridomyces roridus TaxID=1738132 RepID=A0AAD7F6Q7_9AGAR|nr:P-loop containing nucleoside triphosphate hydrolase protein [Roridomyces roridus]